MNHLACGGFQSSTFFHGAIHSSAPAIFAQYASGSRSASAATRGPLMNARARNASEGGKDRFSVRRTSMSDMSAAEGREADGRRRDFRNSHSERTTDAR